MSNKMVMSSLNKTWVFDIDGTIVKHNGYKIDGHDTLLEGVREFFDKLDPNDKVVFLTSRTDETKEQTIEFLKENNIRYDDIVWNAPYGERILVNDCKPSGLTMAYAIASKRDEFMDVEIEIDENR